MTKLRVQNLVSRESQNVCWGGGKGTGIWNGLETYQARVFVGVTGCNTMGPKEPRLCLVVKFLSI